MEGEEGGEEMREVLTQLGTWCLVLAIIGAVAFGLISGFLGLQEVIDNDELCGNGELHRSYETKLICKTENVVSGELVESYYEVDK